MRTGGQIGNRIVQRLQGQRDHAERHCPGAQAQQRAAVIERAANEGVGGADQARDFDFFALRHHLQADCVEYHGDHYHAQRQRQKQQGDLQDVQERGQPLDPGRVDLHRFDAGHGFQLRGDGVDARRFGAILQAAN